MNFLYKRYERLKVYLKYSNEFGFNFVTSFFRGKRGANKSVDLFDVSIRYTDAFWLFHSLQEIFMEKVYLFRSQDASPIIIDCGANIGLSVIFFKRTFPGARVVAFEPDKNNFDILARNISGFNYRDVELINKAVWKDDALLKFNSFASVGSRLSFSEEGAGNTVTVPAVALSNYLQEAVDFLKIDIEGAEYEVLASCEALLGNVRNLFIEYHSFPGEPQKLSDLLKLLERSGFRYYIRQAWEQFKYPYVERKTRMFDLQLNIFGYRD